MARGKFIVIDGADGCGKTTIISFLKTIYPLEQFVYTREPGGSPFAEKIREVILSPDAKEASGLTQFGLFWAARADHLAKTIEPALAAGKHVITDRFDSSSYAFQIYGQETPELEDMFMRMRRLYLGHTLPDLYIVLDVNPYVGAERTGQRGKSNINHFDERDASFHRRIRRAFRNLPPEFPRVIISSHDPVEEVKENVRQVVEKVLNNHPVTLFEV